MTDFITPTEQTDDGPVELTNSARAAIDRMHAAAVWLTNNPVFANDYWFHDSVCFWEFRDKDFARKVKALGSYDKVQEHGQLVAVKDIGNGLVVKVIIDQSNTCEKVKVGTEQVTKEVLPKGVEMLEVTEEVDVYDWKCPEVWSEIGQHPADGGADDA